MHRYVTRIGNEDPLVLLKSDPEESKKAVEKGKKPNLCNNKSWMAAAAQSTIKSSIRQ